MFRMHCFVSYTYQKHMLLNSTDLSPVFPNCIDSGRRYMWNENFLSFCCCQWSISNWPSRALVSLGVQMKLLNPWQYLYRFNQLI